MKTAITRNLKRAQLIVAVLVVAIAGFGFMYSSHAATPSASFAFSPGSGSYTVDGSGNFTVQVQESGSAAGTVQAVVNFSSNLSFVGDTNNSSAPFNTNLNGSDTASGNSVTINRTTLGGSGTGSVTTMTFHLSSAGSATLSFAAAPSSYIFSPGCSSDFNTCNILGSAPSAAYTLSTPSSGGSGGSSGGGGTTASPTPAAKPSTVNAKNNSVSVAPKSSGSSSSASSTPSSSSSVTVPNNGSVAVNTPVTVEPSTVQTEGVKKVEYFLGGKLVDTETKPPYKYNINTSKLKGGTYKLVSKTYYSNGTTKQATQNLIVKNTAAKTSSNLTWLYLLIVGIILLLGLGVNFVGPSAGGPFRRLFGGHGGPAPAGWPNGGPGSGPVLPSPPPPAAPVTPAPVPEPTPGPAPTHTPPPPVPTATAIATPPPVATPLNSSQPIHGPAPGTVFRPHV